MALQGLAAHSQGMVNTGDWLEVTEILSRRPGDAVHDVDCSVRIVHGERAGMVVSWHQNDIVLPRRTFVSRWLDKT